MFLSARPNPIVRKYSPWQKDEGCIAYDIFESATRPDVLMICETWSDAKALAAHEQASHFTTLVPRLHQLGEMKLEKFVF